MPEEKVETSSEPNGQVEEQVFGEVPMQRILIVALIGDQLNVQHEGISPLEAPTVLRIAARQVEARLGLVT